MVSGTSGDGNAVTVDASISASSVAVAAVTVTEPIMSMEVTQAFRSTNSVWYVSWHNLRTDAWQRLPNMPHMIYDGLVTVADID